MNLMAVAIADYTGFIMLVALLFSSRIRRSDEHVEFKIFTIICILTMIACVVDFVMFYTDGKPGLLMKMLNILGNTYCFIANPIFVSSWCVYVDIKLYHSFTRVKKIYTYALIPAIVMIAVALINTFFPIIFYIDAGNVYHRLPLGYMYYVVDFFYLIFSVIILKQYEKRYGKVRFFPIYIMIGPIVLGCALQAIFYGVSLIWVSMAIGLTAIYMSVQNEFSYLDKLTGLYNRAYLDHLVETAKKDNGAKMGGIMIDVDFFKKINDTFGHSVGDEALVDVARVIRLSKPDKAVATRFAGDEFIIIMKETSERELQNVVKNLQDGVDLFNEHEQRQYKLSLSTGYALYDPSGNTVDEFLRSMDDNMYEEKKRHHG